MTLPLLHCPGIQASALQHASLSLSISVFVERLPALPDAAACSWEELCKDCSASGSSPLDWAYVGPQATAAVGDMLDLMRRLRCREEQALVDPGPESAVKQMHLLYKDMRAKPRSGFALLSTAGEASSSEPGESPFSPVECCTFFRQCVAENRAFDPTRTRRFVQGDISESSTIAVASVGRQGLQTRPSVEGRQQQGPEGVLALSIY